MRSSLLALGLLLSTTAFAANTPAPAGDTPTAKAKEEAAKPDPDGGYSDTRYVASFAGFAPAHAPRVVVLVAVDEPKGTIWGGTVAAPAFARIAQFALQYLEIPPD